LSIERDGLTVAVASGSANVRFSWLAGGSRRDAYKVVQLPAEITSGGFDAILKDAMFDRAPEPEKVEER
jgi:hypothetical protein